MYYIPSAKIETGFHRIIRMGGGRGGSGVNQLNQVKYYIIACTRSAHPRGPLLRINNLEHASIRRVAGSSTSGIASLAIVKQQPTFNHPAETDGIG